MSEPRMDIHDYVRQLTEPTTLRIVREDSPLRRSPGGGPVACIVVLPSLMDQLATAIVFSTAESLNRSPMSSRTAARLDAIDALIAISKGAGLWLRRLGAPDPRSDKLRVRRLGSLVAPLDRATYDELEDDIRHWWTLARLITGWDTPARRPNGTCPKCLVPERGTLRVRLDEWLATCVKCHATWDRSTIGSLAVHIRAENHDDDGAGQPVV
jgi:hypothetical protein